MKKSIIAIFLVVVLSVSSVFTAFAAGYNVVSNSLLPGNIISALLSRNDSALLDVDCRTAKISDSDVSWVSYSYLSELSTAWDSIGQVVYNSSCNAYFISVPYTPVNLSTSTTKYATLGSMSYGYVYGSRPASTPTNGRTAMVEKAKSQLGQTGGQPYWSWYGFSSRVDWCAIFVSWCGNQCGFISGGIIPKFSVVDNGVTWFKNRSLWKGRTYTPSPGDIIFIDWENNNDPDHVGIVESVSGSTVYTIEGNYSDSVKRRSYSVGSTYIHGYGTPAYSGSTPIVSVDTSDIEMYLSLAAGTDNNSWLNQIRDRLVSVESYLSMIAGTDNNSWLSQIRDNTSKSRAYLSMIAGTDNNSWLNQIRDKLSSVDSKLSMIAGTDNNSWLDQITHYLYNANLKISDTNSHLSDLSGKLDTVIDLMTTNTYAVGYMSDSNGVPFPSQSIPYEVATQIVARMNSELMGKSVLCCKRDGTGVINEFFSRASISSDGRIRVYCTNGYFYYLCDESNTIFVVDPKTDYGDSLANIYSRLATLNSSITSGFSNVSGKLDTVIDLMATNTYAVGYMTDSNGVPFPSQSIPYEVATQIVARMNSELMGKSVLCCKRDGTGVFNEVFSRASISSEGRIRVYCTNGYYYYLCDESNTIFVVDPKTDYGDSLGDIYSRMTDIISAVNNLTVGIDLSDVSLEVDASSINLFNNDAYCCGYQTDGNGNKYATYAIPYDTATALIERLNTDYVGKKITAFSRSGSSSIGYLRSASLLSTGYIQVKLTNGYNYYLCDNTNVLYIVDSNSNYGSRIDHNINNVLDRLDTIIANQQNDIGLTSCSHHYLAEVSQEPTCVLPGLMVYTCDLCGASYSEIMESLGHDWLCTDHVEPVKDADGEIVQSGYDIYTCQTCERTYYDYDGTGAPDNDSGSTITDLITQLFAKLGKFIGGLVSSIISLLDKLLSGFDQIVTDFNNRTQQILDFGGEYPAWLGGVWDIIPQEMQLALGFCIVVMALGIIGKKVVFS